ncbi:phosphoribosyl transferase [Methanolobus halotolerans]|uniref:Phosphoribosyl transferase n=2 Tax=Methanolobus halotolerans TaxID=2052935 RepID=A0A4E0PZB2_9EURY|nr:phosphoribosyl transferase [Methanolobus halotolerans]
MVLFRDRSDAGRRIAEEFSEYSGRSDVLLLALPKGGVPVAFEVAKKLGIKLDVFIIRKLKVPGHEEVAMGAIASGGVRVLDMNIMKNLHIQDNTIATVAATEQEELQRKERLYRKDRPEQDIEGKTIILIDDGITTGVTMNAAVSAVKARKPSGIIVAIPTGPFDVCERLSKKVDNAICLTNPEPFYAVSASYADFFQITDKEVCDLLEKSSDPGTH